METTLKDFKIHSLLFFILPIKLSFSLLLYVPFTGHSLNLTKNTPPFFTNIKQQNN